MPFELIFHNVFEQFAWLLVLALVVATLAHRLKQPLIVAFIAVGILAGPSALDLVRASEPLDLLAQFGIAVLLFVVGLKLDLHLIRTMGPVALTTGIGQVLFTSVIGYFLALALGLAPLTALYVAVALTFSSTIIIVKLLSDKREIDALHGRIAVGFLIVQDILVVVAMILLTSLSGAGAGARLGYEVLLILAKGAGLVAVIALLMRYVLPILLHRLADSRELLVLFAITLAIGLAAAGELLGFSREVGAFLAGVALASTHYREAIASRLVTLRDFLLLFFFVDLGAKLDLGLLGGQLWAAVVLSLFVLVGNPLIVMVIMGVMGYRKRTGFLAGLAVAQISEFSLVLAALGLSLGHIDAEAVGLVTLVGLITIGVSTYMILYSHPLYERLAPFLGVFERAMPHREQQHETVGQRRFDVILFGLGRYGGRIASGLQQRGIRVLGVDFDPQVVQEWERSGRNAQYGDAEDPEFAASLPLTDVRWVVSTIASVDINRALAQALRSAGFTGRIAVATHDERETERLKAALADCVLIPFADAAAQAVTTISSDLRPTGEYTG